MENQELTAAWIALQNRVEIVAAQQLTLQTELNKSKAATHGRQLRKTPIWDLVIAALTAVWAGNFVADNIQGLLAAPIAAIPAVLLFIFAIVEINLSVRHLIVAGEIDLARPIVEAQAKLANLRKLRIKVTQWVFICALPAWIIFPILLGQYLFGAKFIFGLNPAWVIGNVVFGIAMIPLVSWLLKKSRFATSLQDSFAGRGIAEAGAFLKQIEEFQKP